jgi:UDP-glucose 4-epimerase
MFDPDTAVLVTGGAGFIGSHIASALVDDCEVTVYDNFSSGSHENVPPEASVIEADVRDTDALTAAVDAADVVFHKAARVSVQESVERPVETRQVNLDAFVDLLEAARGSDTRVVFASSAAIYGQPEYLPIDESHPKSPTSPYGLEKLAADHYARLYHDLYDVQTVVLRYFNVYGPRQTGGDYSGVISIFREQAQNGDPITVDGDGSQTRDFVHVDDVVRANLLAATTEAAVGKAFNVGTGEEISISELAELIRDSTGSDSTITHTSARPGDIQQSVADVSRATERLGFRPEYDVQSGLEAYLGGAR